MKDGRGEFGVGQDRFDSPLKADRLRFQTLRQEFSKSPFHGQGIIPSSWPANVDRGKGASSPDLGRNLFSLWKNGKKG